MLRYAAVMLTLLLSGLLANTAQAEEADIYSCREPSGTLFFTDNPKHFPPNCQTFKLEPRSGGLILVPGSALPERKEQIDTPGGPWRMDDWRLHQRERTST